MDNINYDKLLDDWAEELFKQSDKLKNRIKNEELSQYKEAYLKGYSEGIISAIVTLDFYEKRKYKKYIIKENSNDYSKNNPTTKLIK